MRAMNAQNFPTLAAIEHAPGLVFVRPQESGDYVGTVMDDSGRLVRFAAREMYEHPDAANVLQDPAFWARRLARLGYRCTFYDERVAVVIQALYEHVDADIEPAQPGGYGVAPRCEKCGAGVVLDKQDRHIVEGRHYVERVEVCADGCGWHGRVHLFATL